ncbi:MAG TPA: hypothetical protein VFB81_24005 [Myxococcales bacterium]|nr:hypothetical protein [Myxococcales bacterium]
MRRPLAALAAAAVAALLAGGAGCGPARIVNRRPAPQPRPAAERLTVVLEPFFENADPVYKRDLEERFVTDHMGRTSRQFVQVEVPVTPFLARPKSLQKEHALVLERVRALRPTWRVVSTSDLPPLEGLVVLVRTVVGRVTPAGSDRWVISSIPIFWGATITEALNVDGTLARYLVDAEKLRDRVLRYPAQPDFAVDTTGLSGQSQEFTFDLEYQEQVFTDPRSHDEALLGGFADRLAEAAVALVEGGSQ